MVSKGKGDFYGGLIHTDLRYWLISHGVSRHEIDKTPTAFLFDLYKQKKVINKRKATSDHCNRQSQRVDQFPT